jgi:glycerate 2-kinase
MKMMCKLNPQSAIRNPQSRDFAQMRKDAIDIFRAGVEAVEPEAAVKQYCRREGNRLLVHEEVYDLTEFENIFVIGAGKAGAPMARAVEEALGDRITEGIINVKYGHLAKLSRVKVIEAGHPVPDEAGLEGGRAILDLASRAEKGDMVLCLISGGGSALLPLPAEGLSLQDKQDTTKVLLACGATIHEINSVRKHISRVKGGGLARAAYPATLISLILSDVVGDDLDVIASGPTVPDSSSFQDCMSIFDKYGICKKIPRTVLNHVRKGIEGKVPETPKPADPVFTPTQSVIVGSNLTCVVAAEKKARSLGYHTLVLSTMIEGETREVALVHAGIAKEILKSGHPLSPPACVLSGGETTVTITGQGLGGRNQEFVLAVAMGLHGQKGMVVLSAGTDGTDGPTDAAGAVADSQTVQRAEALGLNPADFLFNNDAYHFFERLGDLVKTGPTNTNVMDLRIMLICCAQQ